MASEYLQQQSKIVRRLKQLFPNAQNPPEILLQPSAIAFKTVQDASDWVFGLNLDPKSSGFAESSQLIFQFGQNRINEPFLISQEVNFDEVRTLEMGNIATNLLYGMSLEDPISAAKIAKSKLEKLQDGNSPPLWCANNPDFEHLTIDELILKINAPITAKPTVVKSKSKYEEWKTPDMIPTRERVRLDTSATIEQIIKTTNCTFIDLRMRNSVYFDSRSIYDREFIQKNNFETDPLYGINKTIIRRFDTIIVSEQPKFAPFSVIHSANPEFIFSTVDGEHFQLFLREPRQNRTPHWYNSRSLSKIAEHILPEIKELAEKVATMPSSIIDIYKQPIRAKLLESFSKPDVMGDFINYNTINNIFLEIFLKEDGETGAVVLMKVQNAAELTKREMSRLWAIYPESETRGNAIQILQQVVNQTIDFISDSGILADLDRSVKSVVDSQFLN